jgi:type I restriction enzyme S subunit
MMSESLWELPEGWEWHTLSDVCEINPRKPSLEREESASTSFVPMAAVDEEQGAITDMEVKPYSEVKRGYTYFEEDDVLFAKITPSMENGKAAIARGLIDGIGFGSTEFHRLRPGERVIPEWIHLFVRRQRFRDEAATHFRGSVGQQRVPKEFLKSHLVPVPSTVDEQHRIVVCVEALFDRIEEARRLRDVAGREAERVFEAASVEAFEDAEVKDWPQRKIDDIIVDKPQYGTSEKAYEEPIGVPVLRMGNIVEGQISFDDLKYIELPPEEVAKFQLREGDILFNRTNSAELVGKTAVYPGGRQAIFASYLIRIVADTSEALPEYIAYYMNSPFGRRYIELVRTRAIGQANVNATKLRKMPIPVPSLLEQSRIIEYLGDVRDQVEDLRQAQEAEEVEIDRLEQSILARAFRGEL